MMTPTWVLLPVDCVLKDPGPRSLGLKSKLTVEQGSPSRVHTLSPYPTANEASVSDTAGLQPEREETQIKLTFL